MNIKQTLTISWWEGDDKSEVNNKHRLQLEELGFQRAYELLQGGFTSGELTEEIDNINYSGWWTINTKVIN